VFVYGTLKRGLINFPAMQGVGVAHVCKALLRGVTLYTLPNPGRPYPYPGLRRGPGTVLGELHTLHGRLEPVDALRVLDHVEREGHEYIRVPCWAQVRGERVRAWVYLYRRAGQLHRLGAQRVRGVVWQPSNRGTKRRVL
jgi:gamma-glutamylcyclotransferase (GGCT)/AIG2-like uncharacterized protein YtfP